MATERHVCLLYESEAERRAGLLSFVRDGFAAGDRLVYFLDSSTEEEVVELLAAEGIDTAWALESGQLFVLPAEPVYFEGGTFDPEKMAAVLREQARLSAQAGFSQLRVAVEMGWALHGRPGSERLLEWERLGGDMLEEVGCVALCQYDRQRFDAETILGAMALHPTVVAGGRRAESLGIGDFGLEPAGEPHRLRLHGDVDLANTAALAERMRAEVARGADLELDLSGLRFIDVSGLWVLYDAAVQLGKQGKHVTLVTPPASVIRMLTVLGWHEVEALRVVPPPV
jgi:anti-anti-sigma factor